MFWLGRAGVLRADGLLFFFFLEGTTFKRKSFGKGVLANLHSFHFLLTRNCGIMVNTVLVCEIRYRCPRDRVAPLLVFKRGEKSLDMLNMTNQITVFGPRACLEFYTGLRSNYWWLCGLVGEILRFRRGEQGYLVTNWANGYQPRSNSMEQSYHWFVSGWNPEGGTILTLGHRTVNESFSPRVETVSRQSVVRQD
jgi:hypothetical protein